MMPFYITSVPEWHTRCNFHDTGHYGWIMNWWGYCVIYQHISRRQCVLHPFSSNSNIWVFLMDVNQIVFLFRQNDSKRTEFRWHKRIENSRLRFTFLGKWSFVMQCMFPCWCLRGKCGFHWNLRISILTAWKSADSTKIHRFHWNLWIRPVNPQTSMDFIGICRSSVRNKQFSRNFCLKCQENICFTTILVY